MRIIRPLLPIIVLTLVLGGCAGSATTLSTVGGPVGDTSGTDTGSGTGSDTGAGLGSRLEGQKAAPAAGPGDAVGALNDAKIIRTGSMALEVKDVPSALRAARDAIVAVGGYVGASTTSNEGDRPTAEITYRIPADRWETALDTLRSLNGLTTKVVTEHTEAVEVTGQVVDLEARVRNLRASEVALQGIAEKATKVTDVLEVQARLTDVRGQIEELTAQLKDLNDRAGYASLTVQFNVPVVAVDVAARGWEPTTAVDEAAATMVAIIQNLVTAGIWFAIVWLPILVVLGVLAAIGLRIARRLGFRAHAPSEAPPAPPNAPLAPPSAPVASEG